MYACRNSCQRRREEKERERKKNAFDLLRTKIVKTRKLDGVIFVTRKRGLWTTFDDLFIYFLIK